MSVEKMTLYSVRYYRELEPFCYYEFFSDQCLGLARETKEWEAFPHLSPNYIDAEPLRIPGALPRGVRFNPNCIGLSLFELSGDLYSGPLIVDGQLGSSQLPLQMITAELHAMSRGYEGGPLDIMMRRGSIHPARDIGDTRQFKVTLKPCLRLSFPSGVMMRVELPGTFCRPLE